MNHTPRSAARAFTLIELMVTVAILAVLALVAATGYRTIREKSRMATEVSAARQLVSGYLTDAADRNGAVMAGYRTDPEASDLNGRPLAHPMNARYPWRLAAALPRIEGVMLFNGNESVLDEPNRDYLVSVRPNLGLNAILIGGHYGTGSPLPPSDRLTEVFGKFHLDRLNQAHNPAKLLVFASARSGEGRTGYFEVRPPRLTKPVWTSAPFDSDAPGATHGFVDFRYDGKAVAAMLGGNVEVLDESTLRDMRRWSNQAARLNDPDFEIRRRE